MQDITVLVPAAGTEPTSHGSLRSSALTPVAGRPVLRWTMEYLRGCGLRRLVVAVPADDVAITDLVGSVFPDLDVTVLPMTTNGLAATLERLVAACPTPRALVVLGDTFFQFAELAVLDGDRPTVLTAPVADPGRWSIAERHEAADGTASLRLRDKDGTAPSPSDALIGVYVVPCVDDLREALAAAKVDGRPDSIVPALRHLAAHRGMDAVPAGHWFDAGHADRRTRSERVLLAQRAFNSLAIDDVASTITKRSSRVEKLADEIRYVQELPADLAVLFPRIVRCSLDPDDTFVEMELYGYPTLAELFLSEDLGHAGWVRILSHLATIVHDRFGAHRGALPAGALRYMYLGKYDERVAALRREPRLDDLLARDRIEINGVPTPSLHARRDEIERAIARLESSATVTAVHGDLCLSNVLYEPRASICRLIDPRGSFLVPGHLGDPRYDVAKLWHSFHGAYDLITADLFSVAAADGRVELDLRVRPPQAEARAAFESVFFERWDRDEITLITGLMMCSIPALHYDHPDRQVAMYARGLQLVHEALGAGAAGAPDAPGAPGEWGLAA